MIEKGEAINLSPTGRGGIKRSYGQNRLSYKASGEKDLDTVDANLHLGHRADERATMEWGKHPPCTRIRKMRLMTNNPVNASALKDTALK